MRRDELERTGAIYTHLRGALSVPAGLLFVLAALGNEQVGPFAHDWVFLVCVGGLGVAYALIARAYRRHYGRVHATAEEQVRAAAVLLLGVALVLGGSLLLRSRAAFSLDLPVNPIPVTFAILMLASYAIGHVLRPHHVIVYGTLLVAGALPVWDGEDPSNIGLVMCGVAVIACGVLDHLTFTRTFPAPAVDG